MLSITSAMSAYRCPGENYWTESNIQCTSNYIHVFARKLTWYFIGYYIINKSNTSKNLEKLQ